MANEQKSPPPCSYCGGKGTYAAMWWELTCEVCAGTGVIDTGEIPMTPAEYAAFRERYANTFRTPGWESPELRVLEADE